MKKRILTLAAVLALVGVLVMPMAALADPVALSETMDPGALTLSVTTCTTAALATKTVSIAEQTATGVIGDALTSVAKGIQVTDARGSGAGWSCTMTVTPLTTLATTKTLVDPDANAVTFTGTYTGAHGVLDLPGTYIVEITTAGTGAAAAIFKWTNPIGAIVSTVTAATTVALTDGISVNFPAPLVATLAIGDSWSAAVDVFPEAVLTATPSAIFANCGVTTSLTKDGATAMGGSLNVMTAPFNFGLGDYWIDVGLSQIIHKNSLAGSYASVATITLA